jgi:hypothetical protein
MAGLSLGLGLGLCSPKGSSGGGPSRPTLFAPDMPLLRTGDSISARADNTDWPLWANALAWGRFRIPSYGYHAISGSEENEPAGASPRTNPKDVLRADRMSYFLAGARPGVACMAAIGINSYGGSGNTLAQMQAGDNELVAAIKATGAAAIISTVTPSGTTSDPTPLNNWRKAGLANVDMVLDPAQQWIDRTGGYTGNVDVGNGDTLHPNVPGGICGGRSLAAALIALGYDLGAPYGASGNPADNLLASTTAPAIAAPGNSIWSFTTTTGGTKAGANSASINGLVPDRCTLTLASAGVTADISVVTKLIPCLVPAAGGGWVAQLVSQQVFRIKLSGTASALAINSFLIPANISPGEPAGSMYEGMLYFRASANDLVSAPAANLNMAMLSNSSTLFTWSAVTTPNNLGGYVDQVVEGIMRPWTRGATAATGVNGILYQFRLAAGAVDCTIDLAMPYFRKVGRIASGLPKAVHNNRDDLGGPTIGPTVGNATSWTATVGTPTAALRPGEAWAGEGLAFTYQWQKSPDKVTWTDIGAAVATPPTYTPVAGDGYLRGKVVGTNGFGLDTVYTIASTSAV